MTNTELNRHHLQTLKALRDNLERRVAAQGITADPVAYEQLEALEILLHEHDDYGPGLVERLRDELSDAKDAEGHAENEAAEAKADALALTEYVIQLEAVLEMHTLQEVFDKAITHRPDELSPALWRHLGW